MDAMYVPALEQIRVGVDNVQRSSRPSSESGSRCHQTLAECRTAAVQNEERARRGVRSARSALLKASCGPLRERRTLSRESGRGQGDRTPERRNSHDAAAVLSGAREGRVEELPPPPCSVPFVQALGSSVLPINTPPQLGQPLSTPIPLRAFPSACPLPPVPTAAPPTSAWFCGARQANTAQPLVAVPAALARSASPMHPMSRRSVSSLPLTEAPVYVQSFPPPSPRYGVHPTVMQQPTAVRSQSPRQSMIVTPQIAANTPEKTEACKYVGSALRRLAGRQIANTLKVAANRRVSFAFRDWWHRVHASSSSGMTDNSQAKTQRDRLRWVLASAESAECRRVAAHERNLAILLGLRCLSGSLQKLRQRRQLLALRSLVRESSKDAARPFRPSSTCGPGSSSQIWSGSGGTGGTCTALDSKDLQDHPSASSAEPSGDVVMLGSARSPLLNGPPSWSSLSDNGFVMLPPPRPSPRCHEQTGVDVEGVRRLAVPHDLKSGPCWRNEAWEYT